MSIPEALRAGLKLAEPDLFVNGFPHAVFRDLRREKPVCWSDWEGGPGFWSFLRFDDITRAGMDPKVFSSATENGGHRIFDEQVAGVAGTGTGTENPIGTPFISRDPPKQIEQRATLMQAVTQSKLIAMEDRIRQRVVRLLDAVPDRTPYEVVKNLSAPIPIKTLAELLDMPEDREVKLVEWTNALIGEDDPEFRQSPAYMQQVLGDLLGYSAELREARLGSDRTDVITLLSRDRTGKEVPLKDFFANIVLVLVGGNETTRNSISGGLIALANKPEQWRQLCDDPSLIPGAVNEIVRWVSPVMHMRRTVMEDVEVRGVTVPKGAKVLLWFPSANRDEEVWANPYEFDITRPIVKHRGFGSGAHVCAGSRLAEMQIRVFLEEAIKRFRQFKLSGEVPRIRSNFIDGIKQLPMSFERI